MSRYSTVSLLVLLFCLAVSVHANSAPAKWSPKHVTREQLRQKAKAKAKAGVAKRQQAQPSAPIFTSCNSDGIAGYARGASYNLLYNDISSTVFNVANEWECLNACQKKGSDCSGVSYVLSRNECWMKVASARWQDLQPDSNVVSYMKGTTCDGMYKIAGVRTCCNTIDRAASRSFSSCAATSVSGFALDPDQNMFYEDVAIDGVIGPTMSSQLDCLRKCKSMGDGCSGVFWGGSSTDPTVSGRCYPKSGRSDWSNTLAASGDPQMLIKKGTCEQWYPQAGAAISRCCNTVDTPAPTCSGPALAGYAYLPSMNTFSGDIIDYPATDTWHCMDLCNHNNGCTGAVFSSTAKHCWLKGSTTDYTTFISSTSDLSFMTKARTCAQLQQIDPAHTASCCQTADASMPLNTFPLCSEAGIQGFAVLAGIDEYAPNDSDAWHYDNDQECQYKCSRRSDCVAAVWAPGNKYCYLKTQANPTSTLASNSDFQAMIKGTCDNVYAANPLRASGCCQSRGDQLNFPGPVSPYKIQNAGQVLAARISGWVADYPIPGGGAISLSESDCAAACYRRRPAAAGGLTQCSGYFWANWSNSANGGNCRMIQGSINSPQAGGQYNWRRSEGYNDVAVLFGGQTGDFTNGQFGTATCGELQATSTDPNILLQCSNMSV